MLQEIELERLSKHIVNITCLLLSEVTTHGTILVRDGNKVEEDIVSSHHITELLHRFGNDLFSHHTKLMVNAMKKSSICKSQFVIDSISQISPEDPEIHKAINNEIIPTQSDFGSFTRYHAFLQGGDFFSTLWCVKIIQNVGEAKYEDAVKKAFQYLSTYSNDSKLQINQLGFLYMLIKRSSLFKDDSLSNTLRKKLIHFLENNEVSPENLLWTLYVCEDLLVDNSDYEAKCIVEKKLSIIMNLNEEATGLPPMLYNLYEVAHRSVFNHSLARSCITCFLILSPESRKKVAYLTNETWHSQCHETAYFIRKNGVKIKEYLKMFGNLHKEFEVYEETLKDIWDQTPFEKSVFIMMPFKKGVKYRELTDAIKKACSDRGYYAIRTDDEKRSKFSDRLWDNIVINMVSCKYAVAVYVNDPVVDKLDKDEFKMFPNPNVALEYGFFKSRGQKILLLKDEKSSLPSDLQGFCWNSFDIEDPKIDVTKAVNCFLDQIELEGRESTNNSED